MRQSLLALSRINAPVECIVWTYDFLSQVSAWIKDTYPDREIFGSFSKDIRASDYGSDGRYCLTITCTQNLKGVAAKRELLDQFFTPNGSRKDMTPQQEMEKDSC